MHEVEASFGKDCAVLWDAPGRSFGKDCAVLRSALRTVFRELWEGFRVNARGGGEFREGLRRFVGRTGQEFREGLRRFAFGLADRISGIMGRFQSKCTRWRRVSGRIAPFCGTHRAGVSGRIAPFCVRPCGPYFGNYGKVSE